MLVYAKPLDYLAWTGSEDSPTNIVGLLRSASLLVTEETITAFYDVDDTGLPTDTSVLQAFSDATCAQAALWVTLGVDPNLNGVDISTPVKSSKIGTAEIQYDTQLVSSPAALASVQAVISGLCEDAQRILRQAGLLGTRVWTYG